MFLLLENVSRATSQISFVVVESKKYSPISIVIELINQDIIRFVFSLPNFEFRIAQISLSGHTSEIIISIVSPYEHHHCPEPLKIVMAVKFMTSDGNGVVFGCGLS